MPANAGSAKSRTRIVSKLNTKKVSSTVKGKSPVRAPKPKLTDEQKRELRWVRAAEEGERRKEVGLGRDCKNPAVSGKTRCPDLCQEEQQATTLRDFGPCQAAS